MNPKTKLEGFFGFSIEKVHKLHNADRQLLNMCIIFSTDAAFIVYKFKYWLNMTSDWPNTSKKKKMLFTVIKGVSG